MTGYDIIGDVHAQFDKLVALLEHLGYSKYQLPQEVATDEVREASRARAPDPPVSGEGRDTRTARPDGEYRHPSRTAIFVGDLIDRGPKQLATVDLVRRMVETASARCIMGNHEFNAIAGRLRIRTIRGSFCVHTGNRAICSSIKPFSRRLRVRRNTVKLLRGLRRCRCG